MKSQDTASKRPLRKIAFALVALALPASHSWAWWRGGFRGGVGVVVAPAPFLWPYDPYYYPYSYYPPYPSSAPPPNYPGFSPALVAPYQAPAQAVQPVPEVANCDLKAFEEEIAKARDHANYEYSDGDISKEQLARTGENIDMVDKQARAEAAAAGGYLTRSQRDALLRALWTGQPPAEPPPATAAPRPPAPAPAPMRSPTTPASGPSSIEAPSGANLGAVTDTLAHLHRLLDGKLSHGDITKAQYDGESDYLARMGKDAGVLAAKNGGDLTPVQENDLLMRLLGVQESIQDDLIVHPSETP